MHTAVQRMPPDINKSDLGIDGKTYLNSELWIELRNIQIPSGGRITLHGPYCANL